MRVDGYCPGCGGPTLGVEEDILRCEYPGCPDPDAAHRLLLQCKERGHIVHLGEHTYTLLHPIHERLANAELDGADALAECELGTSLAAATGPPEKPGKYRVTKGADGWDWEPVT